jgi:glycosyltransferase involved in cell wall biosynthesis
MGLIGALAGRSELALVVAASVDDVDGFGAVQRVPVSPRTQGVVARALWRERNLARLARSLGADVVLTPVPELPLRRLPIPSVVVVHDVGPLVAPAFYSLAKKLRYEIALRRTCRLASTVVCVSNATLLGLHASTGIDPERCEVIGEGPQLLDAAEGREDEGEPYYLYVGSLDVRKNVATLLEAVTGAEPALPARLVLAGPVERSTAATLRTAVGRADERVVHLGFVDMERLAGLYGDAAALVLPSLYEGFGLPVLEAMKLGVPVVASDIAAVREVAGDAALYVSRPLDPRSWRDALVRVADDRELRDELVRLGALAAAEFSWEEVGARFSELLVRVAAPPGRTRARTGETGRRTLERSGV